MMNINLKKIIFIIYFISYALPIFDQSSYFGYIAILWGWTGFFESNYSFALPWISNFLFVFSFLQRKIKKALIFSIGALTFALPAFNIDWVPSYPGNGYNVDIGIGFIVWFSSYVLLFLYLLYNIIFNK